MRPQLSVISPELITQVLDEAKRLLAEIGMEVRGKSLRERLLDYGLPTDAKGERVCFPPDVVDWALAQAPKSFNLYDRAGNHFTEIGGDKVHFVPASSGLKIADHRTGAIRPPKTKDFVEFVQLADGLPHIAYLSTAFSTADIEAEMSDVWRLYLCLTNSVKPVVSGAFTEDGVPRMAKMMGLFRQNKADLIARPMSIFTITPTGNFRYSEDSCQNLLDCVEWGIPIEIVPVTLMGLVAPATLVGALVFHCVDVIAGICMAQNHQSRHTPIIRWRTCRISYERSNIPHAWDKSITFRFGICGIGKIVRVTNPSIHGIKRQQIFRCQAGAESFGGGLLAGLAGINSVSGTGYVRFGDVV